MFSKKVQTLVQRGVLKTLKEAQKFETEQRRITEEIDKFNEEMKQWSAKSRLLRRK